MTTSKISLGVASAVVLAGASWFAWSWWWPWSRTKLDKPQPLGHIVSGRCFAMGQDGQLYVEAPQGFGIQKRDRDGRWRLVAPERPSPGFLEELACDDSDNLYVAEAECILKRDRDGHWTILAPKGKELGQVTFAQAIALDRSGNLYVSDQSARSENQNQSEVRIMLRKPDGQWTLLARPGNALGEVRFARRLATDTEGNLYVADPDANRILKRDAAGRWSEVDVDELAVGGLVNPCAVAVDASGVLYVRDWGSPQIRPALPANPARLLKRDADGRWSVLATQGRELGQIFWNANLKVDSRGALYVGEDIGPC